MPILNRGKSKYINSLIDNKEYCLTNGKFSLSLAKQNLTLHDYVVKYEQIAPKCIYCDNTTKLKSNDGINWIFHEVCGSKECTSKAYSQAGKNKSDECKLEGNIKRAKTLKDNPDIKIEMIKRCDEANNKIGKDGLTGYERTAQKRKVTMLGKYGREDYANWDKTKETWANKSEEELNIHGKKISDNWNLKSQEEKQGNIEKRRKTNIKRYGMECPANKHKFAGYSKSASILFSYLDINNQAMFKPKTKEKSVNGKIYDFNYNMKIIEFNGDYWHGNPEKYNADFLIGRNKKRMACKIWEHDALKKKIAEDAGFQVKVVWESDYKKNPNKVIEECKIWLNQ